MRICCSQEERVRPAQGLSTCSTVPLVADGVVDVSMLLVCTGLVLFAPGVKISGTNTAAVTTVFARRMSDFGRVPSSFSRAVHRRTECVRQPTVLPVTLSNVHRLLKFFQQTLSNIKGVFHCAENRDCKLIFISCSHVLHD